MSTEALSLRPPRRITLRSALSVITLIVVILVFGVGFWLASSFFSGLDWIWVLLALAAFVALILFVLGVVAYTLRQWQNSAEISYWDVLRYVFRIYLWPGSWSLAVEGGELKGSEHNRKLFEAFGGPGWLFIYPGHVVVFHKLGKITRMAGNGWFELKSGERIKAILPITPHRNVITVERLLTRDRIHLGLEINYIVEIEKAPDTFKRLKTTKDATLIKVQRLKAAMDIARAAAQTAQTNNKQADYLTAIQKFKWLSIQLAEAVEKYQNAAQAFDALQHDEILGDGPVRHYRSVLKTAAIQAPKVKTALKTPIEMNLRDIVMTQASDELVSLAAGGTKSLADNIGLRRVKEIEDEVQKQTAETALKQGLVLKKFDITNIEYPDDIKPKINEEIGAVIDARIQLIEAKTKVEAAQADKDAEILRAEAEKEAASHRAEAREIMSERKTQQYENLIAALNRSGLPQSTIKEVLVSIISADAVELKLNQILELTNQYIQEKSSSDS